jgi:SAM-dependent methyltransferase
MQTFLHVGCGHNRKDKTTSGFAKENWKELRFDINESVEPDYVGTMTDMSAVETSSMDALYSSHNIEHVYAHEVPKALAEFKRVLRPDGFVIITCPDIQAICALVAEGKLTEQAYSSPAGPITPHDILYGHGASIAEGDLFMAHRCGFTQEVLTKTLEVSGFVSMGTAKRAGPCFDLWAVACPVKTSEESLRELAKDHFPFSGSPGESAC